MSVIRWTAREDGTRYAACWSASYGHQNVAIYPPGVPAVAMPGSPIYPRHWSAVFWYPGKENRVRIASDESELVAIVATEVTS